MAGFITGSILGCVLFPCVVVVLKTSMPVAVVLGVTLPVLSSFSNALGCVHGCAMGVRLRLLTGDAIQRYFAFRYDALWRGPCSHRRSGADYDCGHNGVDYIFRYCAVSLVLFEASRMTVLRHYIVMSFQNNVERDRGRSLCQH
jgi:hypothetical protein